MNRVALDRQPGRFRTSSDSGTRAIYEYGRSRSRDQCVPVASGCMDHRKVRGSILISPNSVHQRVPSATAPPSASGSQGVISTTLNIATVVVSSTYASCARPARAPVVFAEANMTTGLERSHFHSCSASACASR